MRIEPWVWLLEISRQESRNHKRVSAIVPKATGISSTPAENSDTAQFVSIALFSGVGLLASLIVVLLRLHGVF